MRLFFPGTSPRPVERMGGTPLMDLDSLPALAKWAGHGGVLIMIEPRKVINGVGIGAGKPFSYSRTRLFTTL